MPINIFTPNMPASGQSLGFTRPLVLGNFANYKENMEVNHEGINSADFGKHKFLTLTNQASDPATGATEGGLYSTQVNGRSVVFMQREGSVAEVGTTMYPGSATSTFAVATPLIDLAALVDVNHPNFWGIIEVRDSTGLVVNAMAFVKIYTGTSGAIPTFTTIESYGTNTVTFTLSGTNIQMSVATAFVIAQTVRFTITPFYFPEA